MKSYSGLFITLISNYEKYVFSIRKKPDSFLEEINIMTLKLTISQFYRKPWGCLISQNRVINSSLPIPEKGLKAVKVGKINL